MNPQRRHEIFSRLRAANPTPTTELEYQSPFELLVSVVLSLPTTGPILVRALQTQDMYLAGSFLMLESFLVVIGVLVSDLLLAWLDPRIRFGGGQAR